MRRVSVIKRVGFACAGGVALSLLLQAPAVGAERDIPMVEVNTGATVTLPMRDYQGAVPGHAGEGGAVDPQPGQSSSSAQEVAPATIREAPYVHTPQLISGSLLSGKSYCTGWMIGPNVLATAAHCLYNKGTGSGDLTVNFGASGNTAVETCGSTSAYVPAQWKERRDSKYDWGIVTLDCDAGENLGYFGFRKPTTTDESVTWTTAGYPATEWEPILGANMYESTANIDLAKFEKMYELAAPLKGGQSGSPLWRYEPGECKTYCAIGVISAADDTMTMGPVIDDEVYSAFLGAREGSLG